MGQLVSDVTKVLEYKDAKKEASSQRQKILAQIAEDEQTKTNLIKKALATQRAKFGAGGVNARSTTVGAVLNRMRDETAQPYDDKKLNYLEKLKDTKTKNTNLLKSLLARFDKIVG